MTVQQSRKLILEPSFDLSRNIIHPQNTSHTVCIIFSFFLIFNYVFLCHKVYSHLLRRVGVRCCNALYNPWNQHDISQPDDPSCGNLLWSKERVFSTILIYHCKIIFRTLDDEELLTREKYFSRSELQDISIFLNQLTYSMIMGSLSSTDRFSGLFSHCHSLVTLLYSRDARRPFVDPDHWLIKYVCCCSVIYCVLPM